MLKELHSNQKTPSFPFYPKDWLGDLKVQILTFEQKGIYLELLCYSWLDDLPNDIEKLTNLLKCNRSAIEEVINKFFEEKEGKLFNKKLEKIKEEIVKFRKKKSDAGKKGNAKRWKTKPKKEVSQCDDSAIDLRVAKASPPIPSPIPIPISSSNSNKEKILKKKKSKYGEYKNVLLTDEELEKLKEEYPDWNKKIENMSKSIEMKGYKYKSHYLAIRKWAENDKLPAKQGLSPNVQVITAMKLAEQAKIDEQTRKDLAEIDEYNNN